WQGRRSVLPVLAMSKPLIWYRNPETGDRQAPVPGSRHHAILERLPNWQPEEVAPIAQPAAAEPEPKPVQRRRNRRTEWGLARTALPAQQVTAAGIEPTYAAANAEGHSFANDGLSVLHIKNGGAGACEVTIETPATLAGQAVADLVISIPAGE